MAKNKSVFGIYLVRSKAESAVATLRDRGFPDSDISALDPENARSRKLATESSTNATEDASVGAISRQATGGLLGGLEGADALAIRGVGRFIAVGPIAADLAGSGVNGSRASARVLLGVGVPEHEARRYEGRLLNGGILVAVHCGTSEEIKRAKGILDFMGAADIASSGEGYARTIAA
jgi:hypothetical protein